RLLHRAPHRRDLPPFPTRRSSDLRREGFPGQVIREKQAADRDWLSGAVVNLEPIAAAGRVGHPFVDRETCHGAEARGAVEPSRGDRKSTRLNSSHVSISYAVFCLK